MLSQIKTWVICAALAVCALNPAAALAGGKYALLIGNSEYQQQVLRCSKRDFLLRLFFSSKQWEKGKQKDCFMMRILLGFGSAEIELALSC